MSRKASTLEQIGSTSSSCNESWSGNCNRKTGTSNTSSTNRIRAALRLVLVALAPIVALVVVVVAAILLLVVVAVPVVVFVVVVSIVVV